MQNSEPVLNKYFKVSKCLQLAAWQQQKSKYWKQNTVWPKVKNMNWRLLKTLTSKFHLSSHPEIRYNMVTMRICLRTSNHREPNWPWAPAAALWNPGAQRPHSPQGLLLVCDEHGSDTKAGPAPRRHETPLTVCVCPRAPRQPCRAVSYCMASRKILPGLPSHSPLLWSDLQSKRTAPPGLPNSSSPYFRHFF